MDEPFSPTYAEYDAAELLEQAQANAQAALIATVGFLLDHGLSVADWAAALGARFERAWGEPEPWEAGEFLDAILANLRSLGATVEGADLGPERATATTRGFPDPESCATLGVEPAVVAGYNDATRPIAEARGLSWAWRYDGERTEYAVARRAAGAADAR